MMAEIVWKRSLGTSAELVKIFDNRAVDCFAILGPDVHCSRSDVDRVLPVGGKAVSMRFGQASLNLTDVLGPGKWQGAIGRLMAVLFRLRDVKVLQP